jgi:hypothetical protein
MTKSDPAVRSSDLADYPLRPLSGPRDQPRTRTIIIRRGGGLQSLALLCVCLLLMAVVLLGHQALGVLDRQSQDNTVALARFERKVQQLESGIAFESKRRRLLLGIRDHILRVNPRVGLSDAYRYAELAIEASEKYPAVDPLLLVAVGTVESRYDPQSRSPADARGLYQIWPSTGRLLLRSLGWSYDENALYDPEKNTQAAALYLDILFSTYNDPQLVLAEYNGGPLNAGYFRAGVRQLATETRNYVPQVLELYARLKDKFETEAEPRPEPSYRDPHREGKTLVGAAPAAAPAPTSSAAGSTSGAGTSRRQAR